jgi:hypothetical protein
VSIVLPSQGWLERPWPRRDENREACPDRRPNAIQNRFACALFHAEELIEGVDFLPDVCLGLERHQNELAVLGLPPHVLPHGTCHAMPGRPTMGLPAAD